MQDDHIIRIALERVAAVACVRINRLGRLRGVDPDRPSRSRALQVEGPFDSDTSRTAEAERVAAFDANSSLQLSEVGSSKLDVCDTRKRVGGLEQENAAGSGAGHVDRRPHKNSHPVGLLGRAALGVLVEEREAADAPARGRDISGRVGGGRSEVLQDSGRAREGRDGALAALHADVQVRVPVEEGVPARKPKVVALE